MYNVVQESQLNNKSPFFLFLHSKYAATPLLPIRAVMQDTPSNVHKLQHIVSFLIQS